MLCCVTWPLCLLADGAVCPLGGMEDAPGLILTPDRKKEMNSDFALLSA